jgi:16S rRNA (guanine1207-N2)-methyltransferase
VRGAGPAGPDAADAYALRHLAETGIGLGGSGPSKIGPTGSDPSGTVVVFGDRTGELVAALPGSTLITDSFLAREAVRARADSSATKLLTTRDEPPERIDVLVVRVPKSLALLEDQLHRLAPRLHSESVVLGTGKVTEIHTSTLKLFEQLVGPTRTSLAERKARLIFSEPDPALVRPENPWPYSYPLPVDATLGPASGREVVNHAGIFCADRLDLGTRFLLEHLPHRHGADDVIDLGCGNGVLGLAAALENPDARLTFIDESFQAVASARATYAAHLAPERVAAGEFRAGDALEGVPSASADLLLNNPPFHSHRATTDAAAWRMFTGARRVLRPGGELWVVGNRHLGYHGKLRRVFGNCDTVAGSPKFVILRSTRR